MSIQNVCVYAAGGCGVNIVKQFGAARALAESAPKAGGFHSWFETVYIDTSNSNMRTASLDQEKVFLFDGIDGSGGERAENHAIISQSIPAILQRFKPHTFNIVVNSASGGSGAIIGGAITAELMKRGENVISIVVGSTDSLKQIDNTIKALKSFDGIAGKVGRPAVVHYLENSNETPRGATDTSAIAALGVLIALFSGQNDELDTADLRNWLTHSSMRPELVTLSFVQSLEGYQACGNVGTVATLALPTSNSSLTPVPAYHTVGFITDEEVAKSIATPLHYVISKNRIEPISKRLADKRKEVDDHLKSAVARKSLISDTDTIADDGQCI